MPLLGPVTVTDSTLASGTRSCRTLPGRTVPLRTSSPACRRNGSARFERRSGVSGGTVRSSSRHFPRSRARGKSWNLAVCPRPTSPSSPAPVTL